MVLIEECPRTFWRTSVDSPGSTGRAETSACDRLQTSTNKPLCQERPINCNSGIWLVIRDLVVPRCQFLQHACRDAL